MSLFSKPRTKAEEERELREGRVRAARACQAWTEITPAERLCARGPVRYGWHVDAESDQIFVPHQGAAFLPHSSAVLADRAPLHFVVDHDGHVTVYQRALAPKTWSDVVRNSPELAAK